MSKKIAIVTGASGGIGAEFTKRFVSEELDEIWAIARNQSRLDALKNNLGDKIITISKDLSDPEDLDSIKSLLEQERPDIRYLVNDAGLARMASYKDYTVEEIQNTISVNCTAMVVMCTICIPYMSEGSHIVNMSSQSSFQPVAYLNLYASTKVFERHYTRALNMELKGTGITATAVCPGWVDTNIILKEVNGHSVKFPALVSCDKVVTKALNDVKKGKDMSVCTFYVKWMHFLAKVCPQKSVMRTWVKDIKEYL